MKIETIKIDIPKGFKIRDGHPKVIDNAIVAEIEEVDDNYILKLVVDSVYDLVIMYSKDGIDCVIGHISIDGKCSILSDLPRVNCYEEWRENGMKINSESVKWEGKEYIINTEYSLECISLGECIYCLDGCYSYIGCLDNNIVRHKHNKRPILF